MNCRDLIALFVAICPILSVAASETLTVSSSNSTSTLFARPFAPQEGVVKELERPLRDELCLNGLWQFQPINVPGNYQRNLGQPPELTNPVDDCWEKTPIKIPSPWNVNRWGPGRRDKQVGAGTSQPYWPDSEYYPSYPESWDNVEMGWLRRKFRLPSNWRDKRAILHFEAVAGEFQVFINGTKAGEFFDSHLPADFDVTTLVRRDADNEIMVGVRSPNLFNMKGKYPHFSTPYTPGSNTDQLIGIWQDVSLIGVPSVRIDKVFVQPLVGENRLKVVATLINSTTQAQMVKLSGKICPWVNLTGKDVLSAPEPNWTLSNAVLLFPEQQTKLEPGAHLNVTLSLQPNGGLKTWTPDIPNLYGVVLSLSDNRTALDTRYERFGWRELTISGREARLNGSKIQMFGDLCHPFGQFMMSRRFVWAWLKMIKDFGGNAVRFHAQPYPSFYLDVADEMGMMVLDETAAFGSSIRLNPEAPLFWKRYEDHYKRLIERDRNHPSVFGWSFGNEMFAIPLLNKMSPEDTSEYYNKLAALGLTGREYDPTRQWISCDGDEDLQGRLPVWSKHYGHNIPEMPEVDKPQMVGESGGTYYARPAQLGIFNGDRAFESYAGRNEALAIDLYQNIVKLALPKVVFYSPSEMVWFGLEHLPYGRRDFTRLPTLKEGVFFGPFKEGQPGVQPERIPPYCGTINPGWDPSLPLYKPLAMFDAMKDALAKGGPKASPWDHFSISDIPANKKINLLPDSAGPKIPSARVIAPHGGSLTDCVSSWGVSVVDPDSKALSRDLPFCFIDGEKLTGTSVESAKRALEEVKTRGGVVIVMLGGGGKPAESLKALLPYEVRLTDRRATMLVPDRKQGWTGSITLPQVYFAEDKTDPFICRHGLEGPFVAKGKVLFGASDTDWSLFNESPEHSKCGALVLFEQLQKPSGVVLVEQDYGKGKLVISSIDYRNVAENAVAMWRQVLTNMGLTMGERKQLGVVAFANDVLINALSIGRFEASDASAALATDHLGEASANPKAEQAAGGCKWIPVNCPSKDRFMFEESKQDGPQENFAVYFSYWIRSPRALDNLLMGGPDAPRFSTTCFASGQCKLFLNGHAIEPASTGKADYRKHYIFDSLPMQKGWNHFLIKVITNKLSGPESGTLAVRIGSNNSDYFHELESRTEQPDDKR